MVTREKRTAIDFSSHVLDVISHPGIYIHKLHVPGTVIDSVTFITTQGVMAVTGDYSNWIFNTPFIPNPEGYVSVPYWVEKLTTNSRQVPSKYDADETIKELDEMLATIDDQPSHISDNKQFFEMLRTLANDEIEYTAAAFRSDMPVKINKSSVPP